jgi:hypothetical protein
MDEIYYLTVGQRLDYRNLAPGRLAHYLTVGPRP